MLLVQKTGILALLKRQPELALRMLGSMSQHLRVLVGQLEDLTLKDVETRLANWLVKRCPNPHGDQPVRIELTMTKRVLAAELGTVSETFSRTLAKFREQKLLSVKGKIGHHYLARQAPRAAATKSGRVRASPEREPLRCRLVADVAVKRPVAPAVFALGNRPSAHPRRCTHE